MCACACVCVCMCTCVCAVSMVQTGGCLKYLSSQIWGDDEVFSLHSRRCHPLKQTSHIRFSNELLGEEEGVACANGIHELTLSPCSTLVPISFVSNEIKVWRCCCVKVVKNSHVVWASAVSKVFENLCEAALGVEGPWTIRIIVRPVTANWTAKITGRAVGGGRDGRVNSSLPSTYALLQTDRQTDRLATDNNS